MEKTSMSLGFARDWHTTNLSALSLWALYLGVGPPYLLACVQNLVLLLS